MPLDTLYTTPSLSALITRIEDDFETRLPGEGSKIKRTFLYVTARVLAGVSYGIYGYAKWLSRQLIYDTIDDLETMQKVAAQWGLEYSAGVRATGTFQFYGTNGTVIPSGTLVARVNGLEYATTAAGTIAGGNADIAVQASAIGTAYNMTDFAETMELVNPITSINSTVMVTPGTGVATGGKDAETLEALKARVLDRIRNQPQGGAEADYKQWAQGTTGTTAAVDRVWVTSPTEGEVSVKFTLTGTGAAIFPGAADIALVAAAIENDDADGYAQNRPITADVTVSAPTPEAVNFTIALNPNNSTTQDNVTRELEAMFKREAAPGVTIKNSEILSAIAAAADVNHWTLDAVHGGAGSSDIAVTSAAHLAYLGTVTYQAAP